jgi:hypothetical protein
VNELLKPQPRKPLESVVVGLCAYEVIAIMSHRTPTLTALSRRFKVLAPVLVVGLSVHLYRQSWKLGNHLWAAVAAMEAMADDAPFGDE